ncbi:LOW QUALITY PROTEIN: hypothetical protein T265_14222 [Opisthorchis viverrini]|uniref:Uncharacterized protein n=1 Tax=Opisthorchis viverrini TaxID=6198 RepID=A0A074ZDW1_OPIVI|nr:LOW QUALITY PROTEIN: hypothetical protein T265_14222 [Opisthorchis viverrini]KER25363.1 LOW QUALITY PROTEIN: hypothetical protein T265_14222 [Opisthorchis viverrini]
MIDLIHCQFGLRCLGFVWSDGESLPSANIFHSHETSAAHNLSGNPLEIPEIVNLSLESKLIHETTRRDKETSKLLDLTGKRPVSCSQIDFKDGMLYYLCDEGSKLFGVFPLTKTSKRILRINIVTDPDLSLSLTDVQRRHTLLYPEFRCRYEAVYQFTCATFTAQFDKCESLIGPPLSFVVGSLSTEVDLLSGSCLPSILDDLKVLKTIYEAHELGLSSWNSNQSSLTIEEFQTNLPNIFILFYLVPNKTIDQVKQNTTFDAVSCTSMRGLLANRRPDSTELLWDTVKRVSSGHAFRSFVNSAIAYLLDHREVLELHRRNDTQLAIKLRSLLSRGGPVNIDSGVPFPFGIESLLELGLNKLTNDCLCLLEPFVPEVALSSPDPDKSWSLEYRWACLYHLYKASCFLASFTSHCSKQAFVSELQKILNKPDEKNEWRSLLCSDTPLIVRHQFELPVSELLVPISGILPSLWIMQLDADQPVRTSVRLVYEQISGGVGEKKYICHEMKLVDTYWPSAATSPLS